MKKSFGQEHYKDCLACNPFEGDFGEPGDRTLKNTIGKVRKDHKCSLCLGVIKKGDAIRIQTEVFDGEITTYRWCPECCLAMAKSWTDDGRAWERRELLRAERISAATTEGQEVKG